MRAEGPRCVVEAERLGDGRREVVEKLDVLRDVKTAKREGGYGLGQKGVVGVLEELRLMGGEEGGGVEGEGSSERRSEKKGMPSVAVAAQNLDNSKY